jgi:hypothetical protein
MECISRYIWFLKKSSLYWGALFTLKLERILGFDQISILIFKLSGSRKKMHAFPIILCVGCDYIQLGKTTWAGRNDMAHVHVCHMEPLTDGPLSAYCLSFWQATAVSGLYLSKCDLWVLLQPYSTTGAICLSPLLYSKGSTWISLYNMVHLDRHFFWLHFFFHCWISSSSNAILSFYDSIRISN